MAYDFPSSPTAGQEFTPTGGPTYVWVSPRWIAKSGATAQPRSRILNGAMQVSQENGNNAGTGIWYAADQWCAGYSGTVVATSQRVQVTTPNGSANRYRLTISTADAALAAGDYLAIQTKIEGIRIADFRWGSASARQVMLRFGFKGPAGTYSVAVRNSGSTRSCIINFTIAAGSANTDTEQILVIPGDVTGTWLIDTGIGIDMWIVLAAGTTYQGVAGWNAGNLLGTSANTNGMTPVNNVFELFDVGIYLDPLATGVAPRWEMPDEAAELIACMRYYEWTTSTVTPYSAVQANVWSSHYFKVQKRIVPAMTLTITPASGPQTDLAQFSFVYGTTATFGFAANARM